MRNNEEHINRIGQAFTLWELLRFSFPSILNNFFAQLVPLSHFAGGKVWCSDREEVVEAELEKMDRVEDVDSR